MSESNADDDRRSQIYAVYYIASEIKTLGDSMGLMIPRGEAPGPPSITDAEDVPRYTHNLIKEAGPGLMRGLRRDDPRAHELVRLARLFHQNLYDPAAMATTTTAAAAPAAGAPAAGPARKSDVHMLALIRRAKTEGWTDERYTRELVALGETRDGAGPSEAAQ